MGSATEDDVDAQDEEKTFLSNDPEMANPRYSSVLSPKFWVSAGANTVATAAIVFVNKCIFENESLRHAQVAFAAFHFACISGLLFVVSRPQLNFFQSKRVDLVQILPLSLGMIAQVVLTNTSLAYCSIQFYQIMRVFVTPCVAVLNYMLLRAKIPAAAAMTLVPVCLGVAIVSYFETAVTGASDGRGTLPIGVVFAFAGVFATSLYTVWVKAYHSVLNCTSMQLLFNQAPVSVLLMLYVIPFSDDVTAWKAATVPTWMLILLSGIMACVITISQFIIIHEAGPVSSTVVGHFKTCSIVLLGWVYSEKQFAPGSIVGIALALGGIISYSVVMQKQSRK